MTQKGIWASDVEIIVVSRMFNTSVFVAMKKNSPGDDWRRIEWLRCCGSQNPQSMSIYITNYNNHFEPVTRMLNCT